MMLTTLRRSPTRRSAFTLLEVLVVVAILVILATVATIATTRYIDDARKSKAHLTAKGIEQAIDAYYQNPANPYAGSVEGYPQAPLALVQPPFGGPSFLKNGPEDLKDPWGKEFHWELTSKPDGTSYILVYTTAPDGTEISQFGIGPNARPKFQ